MEWYCNYIVYIGVVNPDIVSRGFFYFVFCFFFQETDDSGYDSSFGIVKVE